MKKVLLLLFPILYLCSCSSSQEDNKPGTTFQLAPTQRNIIQGNQGGILIIPANSFVDDYAFNSTT